MITIPRTLLERPVARIWSRPTMTTGAWTVQAPAHTRWRIASVVAHRLFPRISELALEFAVGRISGQVVALDDIPDLLEQEILIQIAFRGPDGQLPTEASTWYTIWWGKCKYREDRLAAAAQHDQGVVRYTCLDGAARLFDWPLDRHQVYHAGQYYGAGLGCLGHPGYNTANIDGKALGNRERTAADPNGLGYVAHTPAGAGALWTDRQAIEHALVAGRPRRAQGSALEDTDVALALTGVGDSLDLLNGTNVWPVDPGSSVGDLLAAICDRRRSMGVLYPWWDITAAPEDFSPELRFAPQSYADISYTLPSAGTPVTLPGASTCGTAIDIDLVGDHRLRRLDLAQRSTQQAGYIESLGERILVTVTASGKDGTIAARWATSEQTAFLALAVEERLQARFRPVFQAYGLPRNWPWTVGDGVGGTRSRCDYRCADDGSIDVPTTSDGLDTSPLLTDLQADLALLEAYNYAVAPPVRHDGEDETDAAQPRPIGLYARQSDDTFLLPDPTINLRIELDTVWVERSTDEERGTRWVSDTAEDDLGAGMDWQDLVFTLTLRLPHRVRMATGDPESPVRRTIIHRGLELHLVHDQAIYELEQAISGDGYPALRGAAGATAGSPGIIRDDRDELAGRHARAVAWYSTTHQPFTLERSGCHLTPTEAIGDTSQGAATGATTTRDTPQLGQVAHQLGLAAGDSTVDVPISGVIWDPEKNTTLYETDWVDLDFAE